MRLIIPFKKWNGCNYNKKLSEFIKPYDDSHDGNLIELEKCNISENNFSSKRLRR
jgi:hypothetical protein